MKRHSSGGFLTVAQKGVKKVEKGGPGGSSNPAQKLCFWGFGGGL